MTVLHLLGALVGLLWGSVCGVLVARFPLGASIGGRSRCPRCSGEISGRDLVPVLSFLFLKGRCRWCKQRISPRYPLVELAMALMVAFLFPQSSADILSSLVRIGYVTVAVVVMLVDWDHAIIPSEMVVLGLGLGLASAGWGLLPDAPGLLVGLVTAVLAAGLFIGARLLTRGQGMGWGDVQLIAMMGLALGPAALLVAVLVGSIVATAFSLTVLAIVGRRVRELPDAPPEDEIDQPIARLSGMMMIDGRPAIPFGTFLMLGWLVAVFWGRAIVGWWLGG